VAQTAHLMTVLGVVFLVSAETGSYAAAGAVSAAYALSYALASPQIGRLVDRYGQHPVLARTAVANAVGRAGFLAAAWTGAPIWALFALSALSGATTPSLGSLVRARWSYLLRDSPLLHAAVSFQSVLDELIFVIGPVVVSVLATAVDPSAGLVLALILAPAGSAALAAQRRTEPPVAEPARSEPPVSELPVSEPPKSEPRRRVGRRRSRSVLALPGFPALVLTLIAVGTAESTVELGTVAFCQAHGAKADSGWILAVLAVGSALAGFRYGSRPRTGPPRRHLRVAVVLFAASTGPFIGAPGVWLLPAAAFALGLTLAPMMIAAFAIVHELVPRERLTEGLTWLSTAMGLGVAAGSATAGKVVDALGTRAAFTAAGICGLAAVAVVVGGLRTAVCARPLERR